MQSAIASTSSSSSSFSEQQQQQPQPPPSNDDDEDDGLHLLEDPKPGPSTSAAEFDLEVFDSGSSCSLDDCWGGGSGSGGEEMGSGGVQPSTSSGGGGGFSAAAAAAGANSNSSTCENIDEIVNDHDQFGTDENEDSLDSSGVAAAAAELERVRCSGGEVLSPISQHAKMFKTKCQHHDDVDTPHDDCGGGSSSTTTGLLLLDVEGSLLPIKRKSGSITDDADDEDEIGLSSMKKQCVVGPEETLEIASENVVETSEFETDDAAEEGEATVVSSSSAVVQLASGGGYGSSERRLIPDKDNPPQEMLDWLNIFGRWSHAEKLLALDQLIASCQPIQVRHMMAVIEPQFQRDFISLLPKELALYVLSFLCPRDLLRAAQTCRYWRILCEDNLLWREKCREAELGDFKELMRSRIISRNKSSNGFVYSACKSGFMRQHNIDMNWRVRPVKQVKVLKGHDDHVITCLQFSNNRIVSGSDDNTLKVWSVTNGKCLRTLTGHSGGVWSSQMEGNTIVSGSTDRTLKVWDAESGQCVHTLYGHTSTVRCMHLHKNRVVSGSRDATLRMWDIDSGECLHVLQGHVAAVRCVQYDGRLVVSGAYDYSVKVWNPEREECLHTLSGHTNRVYSLQFDGVHVVSGSLDTSIRVWDVESGACKHALMGHQSLTSGMELRNNILVSGNADSTVKVWDITTGQCLQTLSGPNKHQSAVTCLQFNSKFVITSSDDGTVKLWDVKTGEFIRDLVALESGGSGGVVWRIRANPTKLVCAVGSRNGTEETKLIVLDFEAIDSNSK